VTSIKFSLDDVQDLVNNLSAMLAGEGRAWSSFDLPTDFRHALVGHAVRAVVNRALLTDVLYSPRHMTIDQTVRLLLARFLDMIAKHRVLNAGELPDQQNFFHLLDEHNSSSRLLIVLDCVDYSVRAADLRSPLPLSELPPPASFDLEWLMGQLEKLSTLSDKLQAPELVVMILAAAATVELKRWAHPALNFDRKPTAPRQGGRLLLSLPRSRRRRRPRPTKTRSRLWQVRLPPPRPRCLSFLPSACLLPTFPVQPGSLQSLVPHQPSVPPLLPTLTHSVSPPPVLMHRPPSLASLPRPTPPLSASPRRLKAVRLSKLRLSKQCQRLSS